MVARPGMTTRKKTVLAVSVVAILFLTWLLLGNGSRDGSNVNLGALRAYPLSPAPVTQPKSAETPKSPVSVPTTSAPSNKPLLPTTISVASIGSKPEGSALTFFDLSKESPALSLRAAAREATTPLIFVSLSGELDMALLTYHISLHETYSSVFGAIGLGSQDDLEFVRENDLLWIVKHNKAPKDLPDCVASDILETDFIIQRELLESLTEVVNSNNTLLEIFYNLHTARKPVLSCLPLRATKPDILKSKSPFTDYGNAHWSFQAANGLIDVIDERTDAYNRIHGQGPITYCNTTFAKHWDETHSDRVRKGAMRNPRSSLWDWKLAMDEIGYPVKISSGTLLGWHRQCNFIDYTSDIDTTMPIWMFKPEIFEAAEKHNFKVLRTFGNSSLDDLTNGFEVTFEHIPTKNSLDIFFIYHDKDGKEWTSLWVRKNELHRIYFAPGILVENKVADFLGIRVMIPHDPVEYLYSSYGAGWMEPKSKWTWYNSVSNQFKPPHPRWPEVNPIEVHPNVTIHRAEKLRRIREENIRKGLFKPDDGV
jgi:hypothetical protein